MKGTRNGVYITGAFTNANHLFLRVKVITAHISFSFKVVHIDIMIKISEIKGQYITNAMLNTNCLRPFSVYSFTPCSNVRCDTIGKSPFKNTLTRPINRLHKAVLTI